MKKVFLQRKGKELLRDLQFSHLLFENKKWRGIPLWITLVL